MSHYGISATHWNVNVGEIDEVRLHRVVRQGRGVFALSHSELAWCSDVADLINGGDTVWVIVTDVLGRYKNTERVRVNTKDGGRRSLYSCTKDGTPTSALTDLPRYLRSDDPLPKEAKELLTRAKNRETDEYPVLTQRYEGFEVVGLPKVRQVRESSVISAGHVQSRDVAHAQVVELLGRNRLIDELLDAGLEVALPIGKQGFDLIAYADRDERVKQFVGYPIRIKASYQRYFGVHPKYAKSANLILTYVWNLRSPDDAVTYALTSSEANGVADAMGWTKTSCWQEDGYCTSNPSDALLKCLQPYRMTPDAWSKKVTAG